MKKTHQKINNLPHLKQARRDLRNQSTTAEIMLWGYLKHSQLEGRKFRRQHSVLNFILDFYCPSEKLAIELDGSGHLCSDQVVYDQERTKVLMRFGIRVVRFKNERVFEQIGDVLKEIKRYFNAVEKK